MAEMHHIRFRLGLRLRPRWGAYSAPPDLLAGFRGLLLRERKGKEGGKGRDGEEGKEGEGKRKERKGEKRLEERE